MSWFKSIFSNKEKEKELDEFDKRFGFMLKLGESKRMYEQVKIHYFSQQNQS